ncbi:Panacea domain-containing protein [Helicobacter pylori]|nr:type II toxin-antitoxin system antitoxin SocA domain-containing protein [Helicobacter pylori]
MKALDAAKILINLSLDNQKPITNLKLQKMLYIAQAESDSKLIKIKEDFQAWDYGPVIPDVYRNFCINGSTPITKREEIPNNIDREKEKELAKIYN